MLRPIHASRTVKQLLNYASALFNCCSVTTLSTRLGKARDIEFQVRLNQLRTKQYDECNKLFTETLQKVDDRLLEFIRMRVSTILAKVAGDGYEEVGYGTQRDDLASTAVAKTPRPDSHTGPFSNYLSSGDYRQMIITLGANLLNLPGEAIDLGFSLRWVKPSESDGSKNDSYHIQQNVNELKKRTATATARHQTGAHTSRARTALHTAARASRAATATASGVSMGPIAIGAPLTLTLLTKQDKLFSTAAKTLFEYVYYCEGDVRKALEIALQARKLDKNPDWWWDYSMSKCYNALGMQRTAEESLRQALKKNKHIAIYLRLVAVYVELNQPLSALEVCKQGLSVFHQDTALTLEQARIHEEMGNSSLAVQDYRRVAIEDPTNMEATANIAMYNFYNDQPEMALRYYRRLLATSEPSAEIYNNLGLCCLHCNQWDLTLPCFRQALYFATNAATRAEIWYNLGHVALSTGDLNLSRRCLQLSLAMSSDHEAARRALRAIDAQSRSIKPVA